MTQAKCLVPDFVLNVSTRVGKAVQVGANSERTTDVSLAYYQPAGEVPFDASQANLVSLLQQSGRGRTRSGSILPA